MEVIIVLTILCNSGLRYNQIMLTYYIGLLFNEKQIYIYGLWFQIGYTKQMSFYYCIFEGIC